MNLKLIVNADDYGHTRGVSAGIRQAHLQGIVTSTTAMMNMPGVEEDLLLALGKCPRLGLGVHLVLTTGSPLLARDRLRTITGDDGLFYGEYGLIDRLAGIDPEEVRREWRGQVEKFQQVTGRAPDHLDSHHHASYLTPDLFRIQLELARELDCAIRLPLGEIAADVVSELPDGMARQTLAEMPLLLREFAPRHPDRFLKSLYDETVTLDNLQALLETLPEGTTEIMCHPGYADPELIESSIYHQQREKELAVYTDPAVRAKIEQCRIQLISFSEV